MKPLSPTGLTLPLACGMAGLPLWIEAPIWGAAASLGTVVWTYAAWRHGLDLRPPLPSLEGERFEPLDVAIAWRTSNGAFPTARRGWRATLTEDDLWIGPVHIVRFWGGDRDHIRIPRLDVVACDLATDAEVRIRFLDEESRAQEIRLTHVGRAEALATALGYVKERGSRIGDRGFPE